MAMDTFVVFAASYDTLGAAEADYNAVRDFYLTSGFLETHDAAAIARNDAGKVSIVVTHEQPTRQGAWRELGIGLAGGALVTLFPAAGIGTGLGAGLPLGAAGWGGLCALAGHVSAAGGIRGGEVQAARQRAGRKPLRVTTWSAPLITDEFGCAEPGASPVADGARPPR